MMAKLNKTTHLMILFTFAIVFVVIYLYYTIGDVRKMSGEVKRLTADVSRLNQDVQNILSSIKIGVPTSSNAALVQQKPAAQPVPTPVVVQTQVTKTVSNAPQCAATESSEDEDDVESENDASSVNTEELKKIINDVDDEVQENEMEEQPTIAEDTSNNVHSEDELRKMKYDDIKEVCKSRGISTKGNKDQLINKLLTATPNS